MNCRYLLTIFVLCSGYVHSKSFAEGLRVTPVSSNDVRKYCEKLNVDDTGEWRMGQLHEEYCLDRMEADYVHAATTEWLSAFQPRIFEMYSPDPERKIRLSIEVSVFVWQQLTRRIDERFIERVVNMLGLSPDQADELRMQRRREWMLRAIRESRNSEFGGGAHLDLVAMIEELGAGVVSHEPIAAILKKHARRVDTLLLTLDRELLEQGEKMNAAVTAIKQGRDEEDEVSLRKAIDELIEFQARGHALGARLREYNLEAMREIETRLTEAERLSLRAVLAPELFPYLYDAGGRKLLHELHKALQRQNVPPRTQEQLLTIHLRMHSREKQIVSEVDSFVFDGGAKLRQEGRAKLYRLYELPVTGSELPSVDVNAKIVEWTRLVNELLGELAAISGQTEGDNRQ